MEAAQRVLKRNDSDYRRYTADKDKRTRQEAVAENATAMRIALGDTFKDFVPQVAAACGEQVTKAKEATFPPQLPEPSTGGEQKGQITPLKLRLLEAEFAHKIKFNSGDEEDIIALLKTSLRATQHRKCGDNFLLKHANNSHPPTNCEQKARLIVTALKQI